MTTVVVLLGADSPVVRAVAAVLHDWSAVGLVRDHVWVDEAHAGRHPQDLTVPATLVRSGTRRPARLHDHLADERDLLRLRLCAVSVVGGRTRLVRQDRADELLNGLRSLRPAITPVHCLLARHGGDGWDGTGVMMQWQNVLVAPEDAWDPRSSPAPMDTSTDEQAFVAHAAAALAGVAGLWTGVAEAPLDSERAQGEVVTPVRCFMRRLDASEVADALRAQLTDVTRALPRPRTARGQLPYFGSPDRACDEMARRVLARHAGLFARRRPPPPQAVRPQRVGPLAALRMFGAFVLAALRNVPKLWLNSVLAATARTVQVGVFGPGQSQYEVVVRGVTPSGAPAGPSDVAVAAERLGEVIGGPVESRVHGLDLFWQDVVAGALTLGDGQERSVGPVLLDDEPGVVRLADHLAPDPALRFVLPAHVAAHLDVGELRSWDVPGAHALRAKLVMLAEEGGAPAHAAGRALEDLDSWWAGRRGSYLTRIGTALHREFTTAVAELRRLLEAASDTSVPPGVLDGAVAASRRVRWIAVLLGLAVTAVMVCSILGLLSTAVAGAAALAALGLAGLSGFGAFYRRQKILFRYITAAQEASRRQDSGEIATLARVVRAAATLLVQYDCWAPVLGRFVREPYGGRKGRSAVPVRLAGTLPRAMGLGVVHPVDADVAITAAQLRAELFEPGWLGTQWDQLMSGASRRLGRDGLELRENAEELYGDPASGPDSLLRRWSDDVAGNGVDAGADTALWAAARHSLLSRGWPRLAGELFTSIEVATWPRRNGRDTQGDAVTFLRELLNPSGRDGARDRFYQALMRADVGEPDPHLVDRNAVVVADDLRLGLIDGPGGPSVRLIAPDRAGGDGLDQFVLLTQAAAARPARLISIRADRQTAAQPAVPAKPEPPSEWLA